MAQSNQSLVAEFIARGGKVKVCPDRIVCGSKQLRKTKAERKFLEA